MADHDTRSPAPLPSDAQAAELKMRRHLGLSTKGGSVPVVQQRPEQARQRHRFVQDGGVPVVMLNHRTDDSGALRERITALEASLETERTALAASRRTVSEQQAQIQSLETRLVHAELAQREALAQEQRTRTMLQEQIAQLNAPKPAPRPAVERPVEVETPADTEVEAAEALKSAPKPVAEPKKRGRPRLHPPKEPKPVRWWTPSFKAKTKA